jgi:predicted SAM-dependent methyltransferase
MNDNKQLKVILGAGTTAYDGWIATQVSDLDIVDPTAWQCYSSNSIDALLAEHVWEHLTFDQGLQAAVNCYQYLKPGGYLRCAVPDGYFRNAWYQQMVQVGGPGALDHPAASHQIVYTYQQLQEVFTKAGFEVSLLEYCDEDGDFHYNYWNPADGMIGRSYRYDTRNSQAGLGMVSIIIDAKKPLIIKTK